MAELKARGWTDALIRNRLGRPDATWPNPHYRSAAPARLYSAGRARAAEQAPDWPQALAKAARRRAGAMAAAQAKRQRLLDFVAGLAFLVPALLPADLTAQACAQYNRHQEREGRREWGEVTSASDAAFLRRIEVNFLRHAIGIYDDAVEHTFGKVGVREAYGEISRRAYQAIAAAYPALAEECKRQAERKGVPWAGEG